MVHGRSCDGFANALYSVDCVARDALRHVVTTFVRRTVHSMLTCICVRMAVRLEHANAWWDQQHTKHTNTYMHAHTHRHI